MKPENQLLVANIGLKIVLVITLIMAGRDVYSSNYHFICLLGMLCFALSGFIEFKRLNYILTILSAIGFICFQTYRPVLKDDVIYGLISLNNDVVDFTILILLPWIIFDIVRFIRRIRRKNKQVVTENN